VQTEIGEGPGIDASERAETIRATDLAEAPLLRQGVVRLANTGVRAVLASPVRVWGNVIGNLNAVRHQAHRWTETEIRANDAYAKVIGVTFDLAAQTVDAVPNTRSRVCTRPCRIPLTGGRTGSRDGAPIGKGSARSPKPASTSSE